MIAIGFARKIKKEQSLEEANRITTEIKKRALAKSEETIAGLKRLDLKC
ncbi:MAG: hypothetical protein ACYDAP_09380 [Thermoplasmataceae archaeon]